MRVCVYIFRVSEACDFIIDNVTEVWMLHSILKLFFRYVFVFSFSSVGCLDRKIKNTPFFYRKFLLWKYRPGVYWIVRESENLIMWSDSLLTLQTVLLEKHHNFAIISCTSRAGRSFPVRLIKRARRSTRRDSERNLIKPAWNFLSIIVN